MQVLFCSTLLLLLLGMGNGEPLNVVGIRRLDSWLDVDLETVYGLAF